MKKEFIDDALNQDYNFNIHNISGDIETTCLNCGFTEKVPDFIYDECSRKKYHLKLKKRVSTLECGKCGKETAIPATFLKN